MSQKGKTLLSRVSSVGGQQFSVTWPKNCSLLNSIRSRYGAVNFQVVEATPLALVDSNKTPYFRGFEPTVTLVKSKGFFTSFLAQRAFRSCDIQFFCCLITVSPIYTDSNNVKGKAANKKLKYLQALQYYSPNWNDHSSSSLAKFQEECLKNVKLFLTDSQR